MFFTNEQQEVLNIREGLHLVLAPPGSGKTELLAHRVFKAKEAGLTDSEIICLTFTNRAAKGMKERIELMYPKNDILIGNLHRFCSKFLYTNRLLPMNSCVLDEEDADQLLNEIKKELGYNHEVYNPELLKLATYNYQKALGFTNNVVIEPDYSQIPFLPDAERVVEAYTRHKQANNYLDFDDLLTITYHSLLNNEELEFAQFEWIQVDEVQDLNPLQWAIVNRISTPDALIVYFGDYEQAIFSFMGAKLDSLHQIEKEIKRSSKNGIHNLHKNFRSPSYLLDIYVAYAEAHWKPTWEKPPIPNSIKAAPADGLRIIRVDGTLEEESKYIADKLVPPLLMENTGNTAVIVRFNKTADIISTDLTESKIPHFKISGFDLFRRKEVKGLMAFLSVLLNEYDRLSWARVFYELKVIKTLAGSRLYINNLFQKGVTPIDFILYRREASRLTEFFDIFSDREMIVYDTETTGLDTEVDDIIQIAAVKISGGEIIDTFEVYINTDKDISPSEEIHHISREHLNQYGISHEIGLSEFMEFCGRNAVLVAHNIAFDYNILNSNLKRYRNEKCEAHFDKKFDSITIAKLIAPRLASYKLKGLIDYFGVEGINSHNALDDVKATAALIRKLHSVFNEKLRTAQSEYLQEQFNASGFAESFINKFSPIYSASDEKLDTIFTLRGLAESYYALLPPRKQEGNDDGYDKSEIHKLLNHFDAYADSNNEMILKQRLEKYVPEYLAFKESDLYLGTERVIVSTVWKAKGLEFDNVIVSEATDSTYPNYYSNTPEKKLEDARALYVALTRAKKRLFVTYHTRYESYPRSYPRYPSRYLKAVKNRFHYDYDVW